MFGDAVGSAYEVPEIDFAPFVADGTFVRREEVYRPGGTGVPGRFVYFARAGEEWRIETMHRINQRLFVHKESMSLESEREIRSEEHTSELQSLMRISYAVFCLKKTSHTQTRGKAYTRTENNPNITQYPS